MTPALIDFLTYIGETQSDVHYGPGRGPDEEDPIVSMPQGIWQAIQDEAATHLAEAPAALAWLTRGKSGFAISARGEIYQIVPHNGRFALKLQKKLIDYYPTATIAREHAQSHEDSLKHNGEAVVKTIHDLRRNHRAQIAALLTSVTAETDTVKAAAQRLGTNRYDYLRLCTNNNVLTREAKANASK
jgi:hypothetical protein